MPLYCLYSSFDLSGETTLKSAPINFADRSLFNTYMAICSSVDPNLYGFFNSYNNCARAAPVALPKILGVLHPYLECRTLGAQTQNASLKEHQEQRLSLFLSQQTFS